MSAGVVSAGDFTVTLEGKLRDDTGRFVEQIHRECEAACLEGGITLQHMVMSAIAGAGLIRTGALIGSIELDGGGTHVIVKSSNDHAAPLDKGAGAHFIPHGFGFDPGVDHPGNRAYRFFETASKAFYPIFRGIVRSHIG